MAILHGLKRLGQSYLDGKIATFLLDGPILIDRFLKDAIEVDVDALSVMGATFTWPE